MKKRVLSVILTLCMLLSLVPMTALTAVAQPNLTGAVPLTESVNPESGKTYTISDATQLKRLATVVNGGNDCSGATFVLTNDIVLNSGDLSGYDGKASNSWTQWTPIGTDLYDLSFKGIFDGDYHTISGIYINTSSAGSYGLFGSIRGSVKNVGIINSYFKTVGQKGAVVGVCWSTARVTNCYNTGTLSGSGMAGGIVGTLTSGGIVKNCYNTGIVNCANYAGGIVEFNNGDVIDCYNTGAVSAPCAGGIVDESEYGSVKNCYNTGTVSGNNSGGIAGDNKNSSTISNCYYLDTSAAAGMVSGNGEATARTAENMKTAEFVALLNGTPSSDSFRLLTGMNNGFPVLSVFCYFAGGGTESDPYLITNAEQLRKMSDLVNNDNANYGDKHYKLTTDIVLNTGTLTADENGNPLYGGKTVDASNQPNEWTAIGNDSNTFSGGFDGDNHTVSGVYINNSSNYQGLFGQLENGTIKNVGVINSYIKANSYVGGVCGSSYKDKIQNCYNKCVCQVKMLAKGPRKC